MPIDLSTVNWDYVALLAGFVFVATLLGSIISFRNHFAAAIIAAVLFAAAFVFGPIIRATPCRMRSVAADQPEIGCGFRTGYDRIGCDLASEP